MDMDMPVQVPVDNPNADTEWNDILRKHGIIPEKPPSPTPAIEEAILETRRLMHENRLEGRDLDELDALEDEEDEDFLNHYRQKRLNELSTLTKSSIYNTVYHLQKPSYAQDVTEASSKSFVFVLLTSSLGTNLESALLISHFRVLAERFGDVKFCQIRADLCIEGYPERNTPTVLVYRDGDIKRQIITLRELRGERTGVEDLGKVLVEVGAVKVGDTRLSNRRKDEGGGEKFGGIRSGKKVTLQDEDDDDWE